MSRTSYPFNLRVFLGGIGVLLFLVLTGIFGYTAPASISEEIDEAAKAKIQEAYGRLPLYFIRNDGQVDEKVKFYEKGSGHATFFTKEGVYLLLTRGQKTEHRTQNTEHRQTINQGQNQKAQPVIASDQRERGNLKSEITSNLQSATRTKLITNQPINQINELNSQPIKLIPVGANKDPEIVAEGQQAGKVNYFKGNDPEKWRADIPTYRAVVYKEIYPGIDMKFYGNNRELEYDIIVSPGADPSTVRLSYEGIESLRVTDEGELEIGLKGGKIVQRKPYIYQVIDGKKIEVKGKFKIKDVIASDQRERGNLKDEIASPSVRNDSNLRFKYGFELASYDKDYPIIIDPVFEYSTYLGGNSDDSGSGIAIDGSGNVYLTGSTSSTDFPAQNPLQQNIAGNHDVFVTKINPTGDTLIYSTYLGGSGDDSGSGIAVDDSGSVYLTGSTGGSPDFPTQNPFQANHGGGLTDAFVTKISPSGNTLIYSTYLGGSGWDWGYDIAVDGSGNAYLTGPTWSSDFPTQNPLQPIYGGEWYDAFVTKINATGDALVYSTYLGGSGWDWGSGIAVDGSGNVYLAGYTSSSNFPTQNPIQPDKSGTGDAFVTKISPSGDALVYSTYLGGSSYDYGEGIAVDGSGSVYLTGYTGSTDFPTQNPVQPGNAGGTDAFVTKINATGDVLEYSTYLGGNNTDRGYGIAVDGSGNVYLTGYTLSSDFPTQNPLQPNYPGWSDVFITKISPAGNALVYSTYLGGIFEDSGWDIAVDGSENAYLTGSTESAEFPTHNPLQPNYGGGYSDAFVTKISDGPVPDIKANGYDDLLFITIDDSVEITVSLYPGDMSGEISEWWIGVLSPSGNYWLDPAQNWVESDSPISVGQYPLFDLPATSLLTRTLPPGYYIFFFILDDNPDGILGMRWHDYVVVDVSSAALGLQTEELPDFEAIFQEKIRELTAR